MFFLAGRGWAAGEMAAVVETEDTLAQLDGQLVALRVWGQ